MKERRTAVLVKNETRRTPLRRWRQPIAGANRQSKWEPILKNAGAARSAKNGSTTSRKPNP